MQETFLIVGHAKTSTGSTVVKSNGKRQISRLLSFLSKWNIDKRPLIILHSHGPRSKQTAAYIATRISCGAPVNEVRILNDNVFVIEEGEQIGESKLILVANGKLIRSATSTLARKLMFTNPFPNAHIERAT